MEENLSFFYDNGILTVKIGGEIDHHIAGKIRNTIDKNLLTCRPTEFIMDIGNVEFMDSSGLGLIMGRYTKATELGSKFGIANPNSRLIKLIKTAGLSDILLQNS